MHAIFLLQHPTSRYREVQEGLSNQEKDNENEIKKSQMSNRSSQHTEQLDASDNDRKQALEKNARIFTMPTDLIICKLLAFHQCYQINEKTKWLLSMESKGTNK